MRVWPGQPQPLGATWDGEGVNFAVWAEEAHQVLLCLFDAAGDADSEQRIPLREKSGGVWHGYLPDVRPGQLYGWRVDGPYAPGEGHRFNPHKLLVDPYARALSGQVRWDDALYGYTIGLGDDHRDPRDSAPCVPKGVVVDPAFTWGDDTPPRVPWHRTVIYEAHVKGLTMRHPDVPAELRGSYLGVASEPMLEHFTSLGVTAVELLPVHAFVAERFAVERGLTNYWGYNSLGFFAPDARYACRSESGPPRARHVDEFKSMVKRLHAHGIEVILDVVYNHTAEADLQGPTLSFKGFGNRHYYRLSPEDRRHYVDYSGCGNSLDASQPLVIRLIMDSLRYWVQEMHVDGFRFDLAPVLGRGEHPGTRFGRLFEVMLQDPVLAEVKLIAEPWDLGPGGWKLGAFPAPFAEWNALYRDVVRRFWKGDKGLLPELASRLSGSADIFGHSPNRSINFVTCHDGFTLHDVVSYDSKHNEANGEGNRDGHDANWSHNWGVEGPTRSETVLELRERVKRSMLATLMLSQGVPMLNAGDELGHTQQGNNNAYCQDNELTWLDWEPGAAQRDLTAFVRRLVQLHRDHPVLRRRSYFGVVREAGEEVLWLRADGQPMTEADWHKPGAQVLGMLLHGEAGDEQDERGRPVVGDTLLVLLNGAHRPRRFHLPENGGWTLLLDTARRGSEQQRPEPLPPQRQTVRLLSHSLQLLSTPSAR